MVACFLRGELTSDRFGAGVRSALARAGLSAAALVQPDLTDESANAARRTMLGETRGFGRDRDLFDHGFPSHVEWMWAELTRSELARIRYIQYSYWDELSGGSRLPLDAAERIRQGVRAYDVPNDRFIEASNAIARGASLPPMIFAGTGYDSLVCLEGHLRLTGYALAGFPASLVCLVGTAEGLAAWAA
jgi:hypothetical protein